MLVLFECGCKGCKFADVEFDVVRVGEDFPDMYKPKEVE